MNQRSGRTAAALDWAWNTEDRRRRAELRRGHPAAGRFAVGAGPTGPGSARNREAGFRLETTRR